MSALLIAFWANSHAQRCLSAKKAISGSSCANIFPHCLSHHKNEKRRKNFAFVAQTHRQQRAPDNCNRYQPGVSITTDFTSLIKLTFAAFSPRCTFTQWSLGNWATRKPFINRIMWAWRIAKWNREPPRRHNTIQLQLLGLRLAL